MELFFFLCGFTTWNSFMWFKGYHTWNSFPFFPPKGHECEDMLTHKSSLMTGLEIRPDLVCDRFSAPA